MIIPLKRSGMARVLKGSQFYLYTARSSANGMNHTCLCLPSRSWKGNRKWNITNSIFFLTTVLSVPRKYVWLGLLVCICAS